PITESTVGLHLCVGSLVDSIGLSITYAGLNRTSTPVWYYAYYDIYRGRSPLGANDIMWLVRISGDCYYVDAMPRVGNETSMILELVAVSPAGKEAPRDSAKVIISSPGGRECRRGRLKHLRGNDAFKRLFPKESDQQYLLDALAKTEYPNVELSTDTFFLAWQLLYAP